MPVPHTEKVLARSTVVDFFLVEIEAEPTE